MSLHPTMAAALRPFAPPQSSVHKRGPSFTTVLGENLTVEVFYDYTPAESAVYDVESPLCGPGHDAEIEICEVLLMGEDVRDLLVQSVIDELEQRVWERVGQ